MTHEDFVHVCLRIKEGDTSIEIPCCANCKYYNKVSTLVGSRPRALYDCDHPAAKAGDPFVGEWLETKPEDFCSRYEERKK